MLFTKAPVCFKAYSTAQPASLAKEQALCLFQCAYTSIISAFANINLGLISNSSYMQNYNQKNKISWDVQNFKTTENISCLEKNVIEYDSTDWKINMIVKERPGIFAAAPWKSQGWT